ncbi:extracellular solute-binding protein [Sulfurovum sp.]|uniref:extracellular solute-binding protein n=1 Tax=Sulfurovum sp. TaxID=1969726 RepID=UPI0025D78121|nr:extracellular solute-binding protein [Sulfurovum sp.]
MKSKILLAVSVLLFTSGVPFAKETLKIITWKGYAPKALVKKFEKETGIRVKITYSNNEEMIAKLRATRGAGFDLAQPSQDRISFVQKQFPVYQPIDYAKVNTDQLVPSMLDAVKNNTLVDGKSYAVPFCYGTTGLIVNKKEAPEANDWSALWNPKYKGKISYRLKRPILIATAFGLGEDPFALYGDIEAYKKLMAKVEKKLIETKSYVKSYWTSGDTQVNIIKSGDANVISGWDGKGWEVHKVNPDIDYVAPKSGALGWIDTFAIPAKAKNVEAAYKWINFMLSAKNAAYFTNKEKYGTASKGAPEFLDEEIKADFKRSFIPEDIENIKWQPPVPAGFEAIESEVLDRIKAAR